MDLHFEGLEAVKSFNLKIRRCRVDISVHYVLYLKYIEICKVFPSLTKTTCPSLYLSLT